MSLLTLLGLLVTLVLHHSQIVEIQKKNGRISPKVEYRYPPESQHNQYPLGSQYNQSTAEHKMVRSRNEPSLDKSHTRQWGIPAPGWYHNYSDHSWFNLLARQLISFRLRQTHQTSEELQFIKVPANLSSTENLLSLETSFCGPSSLCNNTSIPPSRAMGSYSHCEGCRCDQCHVYGDCCLDEVLLGERQDSEKFYMECVSGTEAFPSNTFSKYYFISRCPRNYYNNTVISSCEKSNQFAEQVLDFPPVYSQDTQLNYINAYCARCHGDGKRLDAWKLRLTCDEDVDVSLLKSKQDLLKLLTDGQMCQPGLVPPEGAAYRQCMTNRSIISQCNQTGLWNNYSEELEQACSMYTNVISEGSLRFRNVFCGMCNQPIDYRWYIVKSNTVHTDGVFPSSRFAAFSKIFDLTLGRSESSVNDEKLRECGAEEEVYDPHEKQCRKFFCGPGRIVSNHTCMTFLQSTRGVGYRTLHDIHLDKLPSTVLGPNDIWTFYKDEIGDSLAVLQPAFQRFLMHVCYQVERNLSEVTTDRVLSVELEYNVVVGTDMAQNETEFYLMNMLNLSWFQKSPSWRPQFYKLGSKMGAVKNVNCETVVNETLSLKVRQNISFITLDKLSQCTQIELQSSEYTGDSEGDGITVKDTGMRLKASEYLLVDDLVRICVNYSGWYQESDRDEVMLTLICTLISLASLFVTFILYWSSPSRSTIPGVITILLVITLFVAQALFLVHEFPADKKWMCQSMGLAVHYLWLAVFTWKNVAAYHMYVAFTQPFACRSVAVKRCLLKYALYAFGAPLIIVSCYVISQVILTNGNSLGYENCFLAKKIQLGVAFVAPVGITFSLNVFFFFKAVRAVGKMKDFEKNSNQTNSSHISLYIKMSLLLGGMWVVGFMANVDQSGSRVLWYVFDALNAGTGLLILFTQVCNQTTRDRVKNFIFNQTKAESSTTHSELDGRSV